MLSSIDEKKKRFSETYVINKKYLGEEPEYEVGYELESLEYIKAYNWYHYMCDEEDAREYLFTYAKDNSFTKEVIQAIRDAEPVDVSLTLGWAARISSRGATIPEKLAAKLKDFLNSLSELVEMKKEARKETSPKRVFNIQDNLKNKIFDFISEIHSFLDKRDYTNDVYNLLKIKALPSSQVSKIVSEFTPILQEFKSIPSHEDLREAYKNFSMVDIKSRVNYLQSILDDCNRYASNNKGSKVKKNKNPIKAHASLKKIENFKYMKEDINSKVTSFNPLMILESSEVWLFNTKYFFVTHLKVEEGKSFEIRGSTIYNFNEKLSGCKYIRKGTKEKLDEILAGSKISLKKYFENIKGDPAIITGRSNENTILLKYSK